MLTYKGYIAKVEVDTDAEVIHGRVVNVDDILTFQGSNVTELKQSFHKSVDDYITFCLEQGKEPSKPFSGKLPFRTTPEIHRSMYMAAHKRGKSINSWMEEVLKHAAEKILTEPKTVRNHVEDPHRTPWQEYEEEQHLLRREERLRQFRDTIQPYLKEGESNFAHFSVAIQPFLKDLELKRTVESTKAQPLESSASSLWPNSDLNSSMMAHNRLDTVTQSIEQSHC